MQFKLVSKFGPAGGQPKVIEKMTRNIGTGEKDQVLLGVTGSGKTFVIANLIKNTQRPALIITHNKTLGAQLYQEFKEFFPQNGVHYFVSYYDYYQPEAYIPQTDTYIEKDSKINETIDRLRHAATQDLLSRKDVIVCASVSCIYNIGSPENYQTVSIEIETKQKTTRKAFIGRLVAMQYQRNDIEFTPDTFRVRGDAVEIYLVTGEKVVRVEFSNDRIEKISIADSALKPEFKVLKGKLRLFPGHFWVAPAEKIELALSNIGTELKEQLKKLKKQKKLLEAERLEQRTEYDLEMMRETGFCHGIENYSRHLEFRRPGDPPFSLVDYFRYSFGNDFLIFIDESHMTIPQLNAMARQDRVRKQTLIDYGFRLPSAIDNRPLTFKEFEKRRPQTIYVSATPNLYERGRSGKNVIEQLIRPTGLLEPSIQVKPTKNQLNDLLSEIQKRIAEKERTLVLTLTKRLAEAVSDYLIEQGIKAIWLHAEVKTLERPEILKNLRQGKYDVLVGVNLLREGLDLPEVSLVAILDADKEGFLRNETTLIQIMGRAARHPKGSIILYADKITGSMQAATNEIKRRRKIQEEYNKKHKITPQPIIKEIRDWGFTKKEDIASELWLVQDKKLLEREMKEAASNLDFERAAEIRDLIKKLRK